MRVEQSDLDTVGGIMLSVNMVSSIFLKSKDKKLSKSDRKLVLSELAGIIADTADLLATGCCGDITSRSL